MNDRRAGCPVLARTRRAFIRATRMMDCCNRALNESITNPAESGDISLHLQNRQTHKRPGKWKPYKSLSWYFENKTRVV
jgi:hypothetical protein